MDNYFHSKSALFQLN